MPKNPLLHFVTFVSQFHKILTITQFSVNISARIKDYIRIKKDRLTNNLKNHNTL